MRQFMVALAALLVALPAAAQTQVTPYNGTYSILTSGALTTSGDVVVTTISGSQWATVVWNVVGTAGTATITAEVSSTGGSSWIGLGGTPYAKLISSASTSPSVTPINIATAITGNVWEIPLPANATNFRLRAAGTGTTTTVQIQGGVPYVPNVPVVATLLDLSTTAGANNNTPSIDVAGWRQVTVSIVQTSAATGAASLNIVDDAGAAIAIGTSASIAVGTFAFGWGDAGSFGTTNPFTMAGGITSLALDRRFNVLVAGATTSATRIRVVGRR